MIWILLLLDGALLFVLGFLTGLQVVVIKREAPSRVKVSDLYPQKGSDDGHDP